MGQRIEPCFCFLPPAHPKPETRVSTESDESYSCIMRVRALSARSSPCEEMKVPGMSAAML